MLPTAQAEGKEREKEMKTGLILEGGAMRGMFSAGVMDVMMENGIRFDGIIGVSAGAAFGVNYKSGQIGRAIRYNAKYCRDKRYCGVGSLLKTGNLFNTEFCYGEVPLKLDAFDFDTYEKDPTAFYVTCTDIESGKPVYHEYTGRNDHGFDWIRASASLPLVSQIVEIDGVKLLDGGIADSIPVAYFESIGEVQRQWNDIFASFSKGRNLNGDNAQPVEQIFTELATLHHRFQVSVCGGYDTAVNLLGLRAAYPHDFPCFQER